MPPATLTYALPQDPWWKRTLIRGLEWTSGGRTIQRLYARIEECEPSSFWTAALDQLQIRLHRNEAHAAPIPATERLVIVANHPYGVLDGLAICHLVARHRTDFKILLHHALCRTGRFADHFLPVDFRASDEAHRTNIRSIRAALAHLREEGCVIIFPAGGIATAKPFFTEATDLPWKPFAAKMIQSTRAPVVPVYFGGQNSWRFQLASQVHHALRLALILHELRTCMGSTLRVRVGTPIPHQRVAQLDDAKVLTDYLRTHTLGLAEIDASSSCAQTGESCAPRASRGRPG